MSSPPDPPTSTLLELSAQWQNPSDVTTVLMIIGAEVVQKALAQCTGSASTYYTPVCFSFGWVAFAYTALMSVLGDGRLLPAPDHPVKVFNLETGYVRENKHWVVGRVLRDHERVLGRDYRLSGNGVRIAVFEAVEVKGKGGWGWMHWFGLAVMLGQLGIAAVPIGLYGDWGIMLITAAGTGLALWFGSLAQWRVEKFPNRQRSRGVYALTSGNGARDIMVIKGMGRCLDLEEWATTDTPRNGGPWEKELVTRRSGGGFLPRWGAERERGENAEAAARALRTREGSMVWRSKDYVRGVPVGFVYTFLVCVAQSVLWLLLLITVAALKSNTWFLVAVGALGMFQNGLVAAWERRPEDRGLYLVRKDVILTKKVMDGLMDLEAQHGCGAALLPEFFPGKMKPEEEEWWKGNRDPYDDERFKQQLSRGPPRSRYIFSTSREKSNLERAEEMRRFGGVEKSVQDSFPVVASEPSISLFHGPPSSTTAAPSPKQGPTPHLAVPKQSFNAGKQAVSRFQPGLAPIPDNSALTTPREMNNSFHRRESPDWS
ncbi:hypothetical protein QBC34DRAFT_435503 [Podospora aff. communis PSN243]|uniref:Uncharacterized protein n=1 Tax=Podospora aff. communis PSN243 TaxID=3040156 RepID=A0AAV9GXM2_9PEZI|nr:hypothetical protein QBC34DRAFT_435503 [Podospora aff. communis PSN243]